jgi:predicted amidophosphoribosyltransferase
LPRDWPLLALIHNCKYAGNLVLARLLANALGTRVATMVDLILPMLLARERLRERGFNQALEMARIVSRATGIALHVDARQRTTGRAAVERAGEEYSRRVFVRRRLKRQARRCG